METIEETKVQRALGGAARGAHIQAVSLHIAGRLAWLRWLSRGVGQALVPAAACKCGKGGAG